MPKPNILIVDDDHQRARLLMKLRMLGATILGPHEVTPKMAQNATRLLVKRRRP
jgi:hypothetical protein